MRHTSWLANSAWKACQEMDDSYYFGPLDLKVKKCYLEKLACVRLSIKDNPMGISVSESSNSSGAALLDEGAHIFDFSSSTLKRTLPGVCKSLLVRL